jgi:hypothetical protein
MNSEIETKTSIQTTVSVCETLMRKLTRSSLKNSKDRKKEEMVEII